MLLAMTAVLSGCIGIPATEVPLPSIETAPNGARNDTVVIMLPGRGDRAETFTLEGFDQAGL